MRGGQGGNGSVRNIKKTSGVFLRKDTEWETVRRSEPGGQRPAHTGPGTRVRVFGCSLEGSREL